MWVPRTVKTMAFAGTMAFVAGAACRLGRRPPLPHYALQLEGGRAAYLDPQHTKSVQTLDSQSRLSITLRPELATTRRVSVYATVKEQSRQLAWPVVFERTAQGTLRLQGVLRELRLPCLRRCTMTLYVSDFALFPALLWLVPEAYRSHLLPPTQALQANVLIEPPIFLSFR